MGEVAEMSINGTLCEGCGVFLDCEKCQENYIPAYCSKQCAKDRGASVHQVCVHNVGYLEDKKVVT